MNTRFRFGAWLVDPMANSIETADEKRQMEPRTMEVLVALCSARGAILSGEELLKKCWGSTLSGDSPLHKAIAQLRRVLGDSASVPRYIETIRMRGYRTVAPLEFDKPPDTGRRDWQGGSPFRGLLAFDAGHADVFFGRDEVTRKLVDAAAAQMRANLALLLLLGPSGAGKTSVVQAGLLPSLLRSRQAHDPAEPALLASAAFDLFDQGEQTLFTALAGTLLDLQWDDTLAFPGENAVALGRRLEHDCAAAIHPLRVALAPHLAERPMLRFGIFIDRFEALFNAGRIKDAERRAFLDTLEQLARSDCMLLVLACRNDFYPHIAEYPLLTAGKRNGGHFDLEPPGFGDIAQMIRRPAAAAGLSFEVDPGNGVGLDDVLCASAAGRPDALPLLQYCLQELYRLRTDGGVLGFAAFHQLGDLDGAIGQRAEQVVLGLGEPQRAALPHILSLLVILSDDGVNASSRRAPWSALRDEAARQAVTALIESRLFVSDLAGETPVFGIAHDAILRRWPRVTGWIAAHRHALAARARLVQHAGRWHGAGRPLDLLLPPGKMLDEARELQQAGTWLLSPQEHELIAVSHQRVRQRERMRMCALALIVALALLASALGASALLAKRAADARRQEAEGLLDFMLGDFSDKLRPLGRLDLLESVSGKALQYLSGSDGADLSQAALTLRAKGLQTIGEVGRSRGDPNQALAALARAETILQRQLRMAPRDTAVLKNLGANAYWVALIHKDHNDWQGAESASRAYLGYADRLHAVEPANPEWWAEQSYAHNARGTLALRRGQPELAIPQFVASIDLKRRALARTPASSTIAAELADSYSWLASARELLGDLGAAQQLYAHEMVLTRQLRERAPTESMWIYRQVVALQHRALIGTALGLDASTLRDYDEAGRLFAPLVEQDARNLVWRSELVNLEQERLRLLQRDAGTAAASLLPRLAEVHRRFLDLLAIDPRNGTWVRREAMARTRMAAALQESGMAETARAEVDKALASLRALTIHNPSDLNARLALIDSLLLAAAMQPAADVAPVCRQAAALIERDAGSTSNYKILDAWVRVNTCLGRQALAGQAAARLESMGYRDSAFIRFMTAHGARYASAR